MKTIYLKEPFSEPNACVVTIGMFDGVHRGHRFVIDCLRKEAESRQLPSCVVTFDRHPRQVVCENWQPQLLSTLDEKLLLLSQTGIDLCVVLPFTKELAVLSARDFMELVLKKRIGAEVLMIGYDNHFGHRGQGQQEGFDDYKRYGQKLSMEVKTLPAKGVVNSSLVRHLLTEGLIEEANDCLGYPYTVTGTVVSGEHIGSRLGFPTANLQPTDVCKLIPADGAYAVKVRLRNSFEQKHAMTNIGRRPTFDGHQTTLETYVLRYKGELYGQQMAVSFCHRLRDEQRFDTPEALAEQLRHDVEITEKLFNQDLEE